MRLYRTAAERDADVAAGRAYNVTPTPGTGVHADCGVGSTNSYEQGFAPVPIVYEETGTTTWYYAVSSYMTAATPFQITLTIVPTEA